MSLAEQDAVAGLDPVAVTAWIAALRLSAAPPLTFTRVGRGQSNLTFLVEDAGGRRWVLRRPPLGKLLASAHDVAREHGVLRRLGPTAVPTPAVLGFTEDPVVTDAPLLLMAHVEGQVVDAMDVAEALDPAARERAGLGLLLALAAVHAVDLEATGLATLARHEPYAPRQLRRWRRQWEGSRTRDVPLVEALAERLIDAVPEQRELTLVHGDFHLLNVIADPATGAVRAVLDWELCTLGDPLADLGGLLAYWPQGAEAATAPFPATGLPGFPSREALADAYGEATGRDLGALGFWHALGLWKIAIICEGVRRRALDDPRNAAPGAPTAATVDGVLARADRAARAAGI